MKLLLLVTSLIFSISQNYAQSKYESVDTYVQSLGSLDSFNVATIADTLTLRYSDKELKARAIFYWIANNIQPDLRAIKSNDNRKTDPEVVLQTRRTTGLGYAKLVQEMMSLANIRCLTVDGYTKRSDEDINSTGGEPNHSWNVVQLGASPTEWFYIDAAMAAGTIDKKISLFTKDFISAFFFANKNVFNQLHFPDNDAWLLGEGPSSVKHFYQLPVYHPHAMALGVQSPTPYVGTFKSKMSVPVNFAFLYSGKTPETIEISTGDARRATPPKKVEFSAADGMIKFRHYFLKDDIYPVRLLADGKVILEWNATITE